MGGRVGLLEAAAGALEGPAEALLLPGSGGVLADRLLPAPHSGDAAPVESVEARLEASDLLVEPGVGGEPGQVDIVGHPRLVQDHHTPLVEAELAPVEPADQTRQGRGGPKRCAVGEGSGRLPCGRGADHLAA